MKPDMKKDDHRKGGCPVLSLFLILLLAMAPISARAHKVTVFAWVEGDTVFTQSKFAGGRSAKGGRIEVYNSAGEKLLEGLSDDQGQFAFKAPKPEALRIVLTAGAGHRGEWRLAAEEFAAAAVMPKSTAAETARTPPQTPTPARSPAATVTLSSAELEALIENAINRKLLPVMRRLEQQGQDPSLNDIIGGIGYIIGLVGLGAYMHARRKKG
jgi:nickel transport protein